MQKVFVAFSTNFRLERLKVSEFSAPFPICRDARTNNCHLCIRMHLYAESRIRRPFAQHSRGRQHLAPSQSQFLSGIISCPARTQVRDPDEVSPYPFHLPPLWVNPIKPSFSGLISAPAPLIDGSLQNDTSNKSFSGQSFDFCGSCVERFLPPLLPE